MKKILYAWIEQVLQFDDKAEFKAYIFNSKDVVIVNCDNKKLQLHVKKPYNKNKMKWGEK